jgi:hypothetical protein
MHVLEHETAHLLRCSLQKRASTLRGQLESNHDSAKAFDAANSQQREPQTATIVIVTLELVVM